MVQPDFGATAQDYARHRAGFPDSLFERLAKFEIGLPGQILLDLGTGTGTLARGFARRGCQVFGIDIARPLLDQAEILDAAEGLHVEYRVARAEDTGFSDASMDVVAAGQCWHWFDRARAAKEAIRLLRPKGTLVVAHFDWLPIAGNVVQATETLIESHNPDWKLGGGVGMYPQWLGDLHATGFCGLETFSYDLAVPYTHEKWRGRVRASAGVGGSLSEEEIRAFDKALARLLAARYPAEILDVAHRVFAVIAHRPPKL